MAKHDEKLRKYRVKKTSKRRGALAAARPEDHALLMNLSPVPGVVINKAKNNKTIPTTTSWYIDYNKDVS